MVQDLLHTVLLPVEGEEGRGEWEPIKRKGRRKRVEERTVLATGGPLGRVQEHYLLTPGWIGTCKKEKES